MKLHEILGHRIVEMPWSTDATAKKKITDTELLSYHEVQQEYNQLAQLIIKDNKDGPVKILQDKNNEKQIIGVQAVKAGEDSGDYNIVFILKFKDKNTLENIPAELKNAKILQSSSVESADSVEKRDLAPFAYMVLIQDGYTILTDSAQFTGGVGLWKKLARNAELVDMQVRIIDTMHGFKKLNGKDIVYDSKNVSDSEIWTHDWNFSGEHTLLVLSHRN